MWYNEVANFLNNNGYKTPKITAPNLLIKFFALFNPTIRPFVKSLGIEQKYRNNQAKNILGWKPRNIENSNITEQQLKLYLELDNRIYYYNDSPDSQYYSKQYQ